MRDTSVIPPARTEVCYAKGQARKKDQEEEEKNKAMMKTMKFSQI